VGVTPTNSYFRWVGHPPIGKWDRVENQPKPPKSKDLNRMYIFVPMTIKIKNTSTNPLPEYQTSGSAGMDIRANLEEDLHIAAGTTDVVPTGLYLEIPEGYEAQLRPRSGLALNYGITLPNAPATIDSDYRGELKVILHNFSQLPFVIKHGDRIAQMVIAKHERASWELTDELSESKRNDGGFGHTGRN
jgi:dUTP pyrophosphatase